MTTTCPRRGAGRGAPLALCLALAIAAPFPAAAAESAVVLMYHRFGEGRYPATNVTLEQFEAHIGELQTGGYTVLPVPEIVAALGAGAPLPDRAVGITIDDAYLSAYSEAWPRLKAAGFPFTVFVSTGAVDRGVRGMMSWAQIRELAAAGVTIGNHSTAHRHMAFGDAAANAADVAGAARRFTDELGRPPDLFAYPYGEYSRELRDAVADAGFAAAFGQQSGVAFGGGDMFALPRFALNETYGGIDRFRNVIASALPLPVTDVTPSDPLLGPNPPPYGFTVAKELGNLDRLRCYAQGQGAASIERLGERRIEVRLKEPFPPGRSRVNCTLPGPDGRWRWFGMQFLVPAP